MGTATAAAAAAACSYKTSVYIYVVRERPCYLHCIGSMYTLRFMNKHQALSVACEYIHFAGFSCMV